MLDSDFDPALKRKIESCLNDVLWKAVATAKDSLTPIEVAHRLESGRVVMIKKTNPEQKKLYDLLTIDWDGIHPTEEFFERYKHGRTYGEMILAYEKEAIALSKKINLNR
ncbi:MAG: hypothetical protein AABW88_00410 [Nanoarchaeota archaeon]